MYKKQPCNDANRDMKINGRRTKTLLYLSRIFCFTGVAFFCLKEGFISFGDLSDWQIVQLGHYGQFMTASLSPRKDDSVFELTERKCFICSFLRFRLSG